MTETDVYGPVDVLVLEFPDSTRGTSSAAAIRALVDRGTISLYDLLIVRKQSNGACVEIDPATESGHGLEDWDSLRGARSGLLGEEDVQHAADVLTTDAIAAVILYENRWAVPFVAAARSEGAQVVASTRIGAQEIMDELDALESVSAN